LERYQEDDMKLITAIIQPDKLDEVREALVKAEIHRITVTRCAGRGRAEEVDLYRGQEHIPELISKVRLDIACNKDFVEAAVNAILDAAAHGEGELGDGKIFISPLDDCIRIRTRERGGSAI